MNEARQARQLAKEQAKQEKQYQHDLKFKSNRVFKREYGESKEDTVERGKQNTLNEINTNDIAYIKGLLYSLVNRVGKLEGQTDELTSKADGLEANQASPSATNTGSQNDEPQDDSGDTGSDNKCYTRATFNCNTLIGEWNKGSFDVGCASNPDSDGWVHSGNTVTYTGTDSSSDQCASLGLDTDCRLKRYGVLSQTQIPDRKSVV